MQFSLLYRQNDKTDTGDTFWGEVCYQYQYCRD